MPEGQQNQNPDSIPPLQQQGQVTAKRTWSGAFNAEEQTDSQSLKRRTIPHDVLFRLVVPSRHIGRVIGKEGTRIQKIREDTRANIKIADAITKEEERVIIINSGGNDCEISDAERALLQIVSLVLKEEDVGVFISNMGIQHVTTNMVQLLIAGSQAGCLIGKSGQNIEKLRNCSGATISIMPKTQLPQCASAHESDRLVQILGGIPQILKALEIISCQIRENSPRTTQNLSSNCSNQTLLAQTSGNPILQLIF